jgi:hypothetical protein
LAPASAAGRPNEKVSTAPVPEGGEPMAAKCDSEGTIHLVYQTSDGPRYAASADGGKTFGHPKPVVDRASRKPGLEFNVWDLMVGPDGAVHVALGTNAWKLKLPKPQWGFHYARLDRGAKAFSPVQNVNLRPSEGYSLAANDKGDVTACWLADKLYANVSHDGGKTFGPTVEIDPSLNPCNCCTTSCAYGADGKLAVLYREETNNDRDMYLVLWDQASGKSTRTRIGDAPWQTDSCPMTYYSISPAADGFVAAWPTQGEIYFARLDARGKSLGPAEIKTPGLCGHRTGLVALSGPDSDSLVAWKKDGRLGWQLYDPQGRPVRSPGSAASAGAGAAAVLTKDGRFVLFR